MSKFEDFDLDIKQINEYDSNDRNAKSGAGCLSWAITSIITSNMASDLTTASSDCSRIASCACSPSDMTACRNGNKQVRC